MILLTKYIKPDESTQTILSIESSSPYSTLKERLPYIKTKNVVILMKFSLLAALEVVILTTSSASSDENVMKMMTYLIQWYQFFSLNVLFIHNQRSKHLFSISASDHMYTLYSK